MVKAHSPIFIARAAICAGKQYLRSQSRCSQLVHCAYVVFSVYTEYLHVVEKIYAGLASVRNALVRTLGA